MILNEKQLEAAKTLKGPVVIIAGPGTGKTKTLVERIINILINERTQAHKIILTTFTNKAARELEQRISERLEQENVNIDTSEMYIGTMHSVWLRLIEENIQYSNFFDNFELMTSDYEQHFFIYSRLKEYKEIEGYEEFFRNLSFSGAWEISSYLRKKINDLNENAINIKEVRSSDIYIKFLKEAYSLYEKQLFEANKLDFSYLQIEFLNMLLENSEFLKKMNKQMDFIMVDEYQDSNRVQEKILLLLSHAKKNICVVGDEDQSIYRFRGATAENILNFSKNFPEICKVIVLDKNYRSVNEIVEFNNKWIKSIDWKKHRFEKEISSMRTDSVLNSSVLHIAGSNSDENIRNTVNFIKKLKFNNKIKNYNQIAVLFSSFKDNNAKKLEEALKRENIEVFSPRTKVFFEMYEVKLSFGLILAIFKKYLDINIDSYLEECINLARYMAKKEEKLLNFIKNKIENLENIEYLSLNELFYEFFYFDYYKNIFEDDAPSSARARHNLATLTKVFKDFQKYIFFKKITNKDSYATVRYFFERYLNILKKSRIEDISSDEDYPDNCIPFLTIHQSKGLEFPVVIVFSLYSKPQIHNISSRLTSIDRLLNSATDISEIDKEYFDFYRKFYVAFTRAKNLLILSSDTKNLSENFKSFFYSIPGVNSINFNIQEVELDKTLEKKEKKILSFTTDISLYRYCSLKYKFIREEKFQIFDKFSFNRGVIVHKAIEHLNKRMRLNRTFNFSDEYVEKLIEKIYRFQKMELDENYNLIIYLVLNYLKKEKENFKYISKVEVSEYKNEDNFSLYGKIDLILEKENSIEMIDFKTGKYDIEKSHFQAYREQLSLYKKLLEKKYENREIKTYLYYLEEEEALKEILINEIELENDYLKIKKDAENILEKKFFKKEFDENNCGNCEFKYYCYGEKFI